MQVPWNVLNVFLVEQRVVQHLNCDSTVNGLNFLRQSQLGMGRGQSNYGFEGSDCNWKDSDPLVGTVHLVEVLLSEDRPLVGDEVDGLVG